MNYISDVYSDYDEVNFSEFSNWSWAFADKNNLLDNENMTLTAHESFVLDLEAQNSDGQFKDLNETDVIEGHGAMPILWGIYVTE